MTVHANRPGEGFPGHIQNLFPAMGLHNLSEGVREL
jgi:hypothetical protein